MIITTVLYCLGTSISAILFSYSQKLLLNIVSHHANYCFKCHYSDQPTLACLGNERNIEKIIMFYFTMILHIVLPADC